MEEGRLILKMIVTVLFPSISPFLSPSSVFCFILFVENIYSLNLVYSPHTFIAALHAFMLSMSNLNIDSLMRQSLFFLWCLFILVHLDYTIACVRARKAGEGC